MSKTLLVTGGAGFIGSNFIRYWLKNHSDDKVINLDSLTYAGHISSTKDYEDNPNYKFVEGDIRDTSLVDSLMKDTDVVVHFAAESHVDRSISAPDVFIKTNIEGTHVLLKSALKNKVKRFHHISTDEVFGSLELGAKVFFNEKTLYDPKSPYSASKAASDHLVRAYFNTYGLPVTITNCSNNYGPFQDPEKFISRMITNLIEGKNIPIYGDGLNIRDWLYVEDHATAIEMVLQDGKIGETYVVGGLTDDVSNLDIAKRVLKIFETNEDRIEYVKDRPGHDRRYSVDWSKIKNELGWQPKYGIDQGLDKTVTWYKENKWWWKELKKQAEDFYGRL
jgi:dTDP-glucose 4,6-dehydratase